ncbi:MAG: CDP-diacylglycerol--glycerol-3-phosphate 3-phosphatidyltransferase [Clostridia bacterium]|nr:CDP-diacylglycerol--glycerol-3-phosphate 3-phosphatidyltransferase [Clostridia bacterium]
MNLPNKLSLLRIFMIPLVMFFILPISYSGDNSFISFVVSNQMFVADLLFVIASLTDMFDGKIARKYNLITNLGKFLDSLADKMLIIAVLTAFVEINRISSWWLMIIVLREFMVTGIRMLAAEKGTVMAAKMIGKIKTTTQMIAIIYLLLEPTFIKIFAHENIVTTVGNILFIICVIMTVISGLDYLMKNLNYFKEEK